MHLGRIFQNIDLSLFRIKLVNKVVDECKMADKDSTIYAVDSMNSPVDSKMTAEDSNIPAVDSTDAPVDSEMTPWNCSNPFDSNDPTSDVKFDNPKSNLDSIGLKPDNEIAHSLDKV